MKMNEGQMLEYAGDLSVEMEEIRKLYTEKRELVIDSFSGKYVI